MDFTVHIFNVKNGSNIYDVATLNECYMLSQWKSDILMCFLEKLRIANKNKHN